MERDPGLAVELEGMLGPVPRGDPKGPLRQTLRSAERLAAELTPEGQVESGRTVNRKGHALGYRLEANRKILEGKQQMDRGVPIHYFNRWVKALTCVLH